MEVPSSVLAILILFNICVWWWYYNLLAIHSLLVLNFRHQHIQHYLWQDFIHTVFQHHTLTSVFTHPLLNTLSSTLGKLNSVDQFWSSIIFVLYSPPLLLYISYMRVIIVYMSLTFLTQHVTFSSIHIEANYMILSFLIAEYYSIVYFIVYKLFHCLYTYI